MSCHSALIARDSSLPRVHAASFASPLPVADSGVCSKTIMVPPPPKRTVTGLLAVPIALPRCPNT